MRLRVRVVAPKTFYILARVNSLPCGMCNQVVEGRRMFVNCGTWTRDRSQNMSRDCLPFQPPSSNRTYPIS